MQTACGRFLRSLEVERNASPLTLKSYREDLELLLDYLEQTFGRAPAVGEVTSVDLRGYVAWQTEAGYAKSTIARRLASLRSFFRFA
ncbi:MAG: site-specific integrase, partial [Planctomycetales bacterium]|nr:site-specific integrase [Planctomycetales bacterium]